MKTLSVILSVVLLLGGSPSQAEPDEAALGKNQGYPVGTTATWLQMPYRVGAWSAFDQVSGVQVTRVAPSAQVRPLIAMANPPMVRYRYRNLGYSLDEYLDRQRTTALLILKDDQVVAERYRYERKPDTRFLSFSMSKSVVALLTGVALSKGLIASIDDPAEKYAKELAGSPYGATSIRQLMRMSSGLKFVESFDSDLLRLGRAFVAAPRGSIEMLQSINDRHTQAGERFVYASAETQVVGQVLRGATGKTLSELTQAWLWEPVGAEHGAFWRVGVSGEEGAFGFFNASLRDWGRVGLMLAADGTVDGREVVPREYLLDATDAARQPPSHQAGRASPNLGYGYFFWLVPTKERSFAMQGIHGQLMYVQPASRIVMVITSVWPKATGLEDAGPWLETDALWRGVLSSLGGYPD